jgi:putative membrane protein
MMFWGNHMGYGGYGLLITAVLWIGLIVLGIWLLAKLFPGVSNAGSRGSRDEGNDLPRAVRAETAMQILQKRYARGELTKEEYETMRHDLST